jgi:Flp pilus assembly protein TadB
MYCPKCGTDNPATNNYCRACREELSLVAQAMKKSLPVKMAGKLDAVFDSKAERFRRDSLLLLLAGLGGSAALLWAALAGKSLWAAALGTIYLYAYSLWEYLAYKHSRALRKELDSLVSSWVDSPDWLTTLRLLGRNNEGLERRDEAAKTESLRYCPKCGAGRQGRVRFCRACGADLQAMSRALGEEVHQSWLGKKMDEYVRQKSADDTIGGVAKGMLWGGSLCLLFSIASWARGELVITLFFLAIGAFLMFIGLWDYLVYRRMVTSGRDLPLGRVKAAQAGSPTKEDTALPSPDQVQVPESRPGTSPFTIAEEPTQKMGQDRGQKI